MNSRILSRKCDHKLGPNVFCGINGNLAAMGLNNVVAEGEAQTRSFAGGLGSEERLEDLLLYFLRYSKSIVCNGNNDMAFGF
jgi:hypothetical protein